MRFITITFLSIILSGCSTVGKENFMVELWVIKSAEYKGENLEYGQGLFLLNSFRIDSDGICEMPIWLKTNNHDEKGIWSIERDNDKYFLLIKNCPSNIYNSKYEIVINKDNPKMISLESDSLKLICAEVQMIGD